MADTIFALATGNLPSAIAVLRISGPGVFDIADKFVCRKLSARQLTRVELRSPRGGHLLDVGMAVLYPGPASYTGEDYLEFHVHGSRAVVSAVIEDLGSVEGCRLAEAGEFSRRGFLNGKMDLASLEGLSDLIRARTESQRRQSVAIASGFLSRRVENWRARLLEARALVEADIDFADEGDVSSALRPRVGTIIAELRADFSDALSDADRAEVVRDGFLVAITGPPNVGKSSLLNWLASRDAAIVTPYAGTTRDPILIELDMEGQSVLLADTAGIRHTEDPIELIGIQKAREIADRAHLVLALDDVGSHCVPQGMDGRIVKIHTKADLRPPDRDHGSIKISTVTGEGLDQLVGLVAARAAAAAGGYEAVLITRKRHRRAVALASDSLDRFDESVPLELFAEDLRTATYQMESILGLVDPEEVLGEIFSRFCIGK